MTLMCRVCLIQDEAMSYESICNNMEFEIHSDYTYMMTILEVLEKVLAKKLPKAENFPRHICHDCIEPLKSSFKFIIQFEESQKELVKKHTRTHGNPNQTRTGKILNNVVGNSSFFGENSNEGCKKPENKDKFILNGNNSLDVSTLRRRGSLPVQNKNNSTLKSAHKGDVKRTLSCDNLKSPVAKRVKIIYTQNKPKTNGTPATKRKPSETQQTDTDRKKSNANKRFQCKICKKTFDTKKIFLHHIQESHPISKEREKSFKNELKTHETRRPSCSGSVDDTREIPSTETKIHEEKSDVECSYCNATFTRTKDLDRHMRLHTGEKAHKCQYCKKSFATKNQLQVHEYGHTGIMPFSCKHCNEGFTKSYNLKMHLFSHTGPYECMICLQTFIEKDILTMHSRMEHFMEDIEDCDNS